MKHLILILFLLPFAACTNQEKKGSEDVEDLETFHMAANEISPNPNSGFTGVFISTLGLYS